MITVPLPFQEAIQFLLSKKPAPGQWDAADWVNMEQDVKLRSFWSAKVEDFRFIDRAQGFLFDFLAGTKDEVIDPEGKTVTINRIGDRGEFVRRMREFMIKEGMATEKDFEDANQTDIQDIKSEARLRLIFDTNTRQAYGYGAWKQGMKPVVKQAFPAAQLIRVRGVNEPRERHIETIGEIRLKDDPWWAEYINSPEIGGFGVPWGPMGFNSGVTSIDVSRSDSKAAGLNVDIIKDEPLPNMNDGLKASTRRIDPALKEQLLKELRSGLPEWAGVNDSGDDISLTQK